MSEMEVRWIRKEDWPVVTLVRKTKGGRVVIQGWANRGTLQSMRIDAEQNIHEVTKCSCAGRLPGITVTAVGKSKRSRPFDGGHLTLYVIFNRNCCREGMRISVAPKEIKDKRGGEKLVDRSRRRPSRTYSDASIWISCRAL